MKVGDKVKIIDTGDLWFGFNGTINKEVAIGFYEVKLDTGTLFGYYGTSLMLMPPLILKKTITYRSKMQPKVFYTLEDVDGVYAKCIDCDFVGSLGKQIPWKDFTDNNMKFLWDEEVFIPGVVNGKVQCKHEWKERTLFISIEEYCIHCPELRPKKVS